MTSTQKILKAIFVLLTIATTINAGVHDPYLRIPGVTNGPEIDGILSAGEYDRFVKMEDYAVWTLEGYDPEKLETFMGFDKDYFYVAYRGYFADSDGFYRFLENHKPLDSHMWGRHNFMVGLYNDQTGVHLMGGPTLSRLDMKNGDISWNGEWEFRSSVHEDHWEAEFKIPFSDLDIDHTPYGEVWGLALGRTQGGQAEIKADPQIVGKKPDLSGGGNTPATGISSKWDGRILFEKEMELYCTAEKWTQPKPLQNRLGISIENRGKGDATVLVETVLYPFSGVPEFINQVRQENNTSYILPLNETPLIQTTSFRVSAKSRLDDLVTYTLPSEGNYFANITFKSEDGSVLRRNTGIWFGLETNRERLKHIRLKLGICESHCEFRVNPVAKSLLEKTSALQAKLSDLQNEEKKFWEAQLWNEFSEMVDQFEVLVIQHHHQIKTSAYSSWEKKSSFGLTTCNSMIKVPRDREWAPLITHEISISAARNEYESFQLVILPFGIDIQGIEIEATDFTSANGHKISSENIDFELVEYNYIPWQPSYVTQGKDWYPDPLLPLKQGFNLNGKDACRPVWITCYVPKGTPAGKYQAKVSVAPVNEESQSIDVSLKVRDFELPTENTLKTQTWDDISYFAEFYNMEEFPLSLYLNVCETLLKNNMSPGFAGVNYVSKTPGHDGKYDFNQVEKVLDFCIERGLTRYTMVQMKKGEQAYEEGELENEYRFIEAYADFLREKGYLDKGLVEIWDEPTSLQYKAVMERAKRIRDMGKDIPLQLFANPEGPYDFTNIEKCKEYGLWDLIDIWGPGPLIRAPNVQAEGKEIWSYFATLARSSGPNLYIDCPSLNHRIIPWMSWQFELDAFQHWHVNYFWRNIRAHDSMENKWPNVPWDSRTWHDHHGEGQLLYPGEGGEIYPSIRLVNFRDGMDDYEYLHFLKILLERNRELLDERIIARAEQYLNLGESLINQYPTHVQERPHNTIKYPGQPEKLLEIRDGIAELIGLIQQR